MHPDELPAPLRRAAALMRGFPAAWCVAGGWALDLYLGRITRDHADVELAVFRDDQALLHRHLHGWTFDQLIDGRRVAWTADERLELPVHEVHAHPRDESGPSIEFLLNERTPTRWVFRRDPRVTRPIDRAILTAALGYPCLCPAIVLLYKSKSPRPKDHDDFRAARGALDAEQRLWLTRSLRCVHPGHGWLGLL